jgi:GTP cyclohydrolase IB
VIVAEQASTAKKPLTDVQGTQDTRGVALQHAGVRHVDMPIQVLQKDGKSQTVSALLSMSVGLPHEQKGTHMSRFVVQLADWSQHKVFSVQLREFLQELCQRLDAPSAAVDLEFKYFLSKEAPITKVAAPMGYDVRMQGRLNQGVIEQTLTVKVPMANCCPCSKAISEYGAHNQRALTELVVQLDPNAEASSVVWIEDLIALADESASCPVFPLLKREDEKWVTERQYNNPKFVEDVARDASVALRNKSGILGFTVTVEAFESIHGHNAWASYSEPVSL